MSGSVDVQQTNDPNFWAESDKLEIVDSIPFEEVECIRMGRPGNSDWGNNLSRTRKVVSGFLHNYFGPIANFLHEENRDASVAGLDTEAEKQLMGGFTDNEDFHGFLRITTKISGFNRGRPYYFMIRKDSFRSLKKPAGQNDQDLTKLQDDTVAKKQKQKIQDDSEKNDLQRVCRELGILAARRQVTFKREHRFQLFQEKLKEIWNSIAFNICVLLLIGSNFAFTVEQLENKDPSRQSFFETVDLTYTVIFCAGEPPHPTLLARPPTHPPQLCFTPISNFAEFSHIHCRARQVCASVRLTILRGPMLRIGVPWVRARL